MIKVKEERQYAELLLGAQNVFKQNYGRFPDSKENDELSEIVETILKERRKRHERTKSDWLQGC